MLKKIQNIDLIKLFHKRLIEWEPIFGNQQQQQQQQQTVRILTKLRLGTKQTHCALEKPV